MGVHCSRPLFPFLSFLQSNDNDERLQVVKLLAKMFGAKDSEMAAQNKPLWHCYLGRWVSGCLPVRTDVVWCLLFCASLSHLRPEFVHC